jgi:hypothetical protein
VARLKEIVFDCEDALTLARFWAAVLDGYEVRPHTEEDLADLARRGLTVETDPIILVDGPGPILCFQKMPARPAERLRIHLDIVGRPRAEEVARILALGGAIRDEHDGYTVMLDPEGNAFCVQEPR